MKPDKLQLLLGIARKGGLSHGVRVSAASLGAELKVAQQTVNRWLLEMDAEGLVDRRFKEILLTKKAVDYLRSIREALEEEFRKRQTELRISGRVVSGMHEGRYYLSIPEYKKQLRKALGFGIYPGTLNLRLDEKGILAKRKLLDAPGLEIKEFKKNGRTLGGAKLFKAKIISRKNELEGAAIIPYKSHYGLNILELVSDGYLRTGLKLKNNDEVLVAITLK